MNNRIMGVIPARLSSTRLPGKVLKDIAGYPMIYWVYQNARKNIKLDHLAVATDSEEVSEACHLYNIPVIRTAEHATGSDRIHEVMTRTDFDVYLSIQADEPTLTSSHIDGLIEPLINIRNIGASTLRVEINATVANDPNVVKVVCSTDNIALYFSRSRIPYCRDESRSAKYYKHLGLYGYRRDTLLRFSSLPQSDLELSESLEQLRLLENGIQLYVALTHQDTVGVDTQEDLLRAQEWFETAGIR